MQTNYARWIDRPDLSDFDQRVRLHGLSWHQLKSFLSLRGDDTSVRIAYLNGELELRTPSIHHESIKKLIARLIEAWATQTQTPLNSYGSWTVLSRGRKRGVEPDECYVLGRRPKRVPDIVLEVIWTAGGLDKLDVYQGLGVKEVWFWHRNEIEVHCLNPRRGAISYQSRLLPDLDLELVAHYERATDHTKAVLDFLASIQRKVARERLRDAVTQIERGGKARPRN